MIVTRHYETPSGLSLSYTSEGIKTYEEVYDDKCGYKELHLYTDYDITENPVLIISLEEKIPKNPSNSAQEYGVDPETILKSVYIMNDSGKTLRRYVHGHDFR